MIRYDTNIYDRDTIFYENIRYGMIRKYTIVIRKEITPNDLDKMRFNAFLSFVVTSSLFKKSKSLF